MTNAASGTVLKKAQLLVANGLIEPNEEGDRFLVAGSSGSTEYLVITHGSCDAGNWSCNCRFAQYGGRCCSHVRAVEMLMDAERLLAEVEERESPWAHRCANCGDAVAAIGFCWECERLETGARWGELRWRADALQSAIGFDQARGAW